MTGMEPLHYSTKLSAKVLKSELCTVSPLFSHLHATKNLRFFEDKDK